MVKLECSLHRAELLEKCFAQGQALSTHKCRWFRACPRTLAADGVQKFCGLKGSLDEPQRGRVGQSDCLADKVASLPRREVNGFGEAPIPHGFPGEQSDNFG